MSEEYQIPDEMWERIEPLLPEPKPRKKPGRPRMDDRKAMTAIFYVLRTGCQWNALPRSLGASSTVHDRFQQWREAGVFERMWRAGVMEYDNEKGIDWQWQSMDGATTKAPLGGEKRPVLILQRDFRAKACPAGGRGSGTLSLCDCIAVSSAPA